MKLSNNRFRSRKDHSLVAGRAGSRAQDGGGAAQEACI